MPTRCSVNIIMHWYHTFLKEEKMVNSKTSPEQIKGLISSLDYAWTVQKPNQGETGSLIILTILFFLINQMVLTDLVKISLLAQTEGQFGRIHNLQIGRASCRERV